EKPEDLLCLNGRKLPEHAKTYDDLFRYWRESAARQAEQTRELDVLRRRMAYSLSADWPSRILTEGSGENLVLGRADRRDRVPASWRPGKGSPLLMLHPDGAAAARKEARVEAALTAGRPVLLIDAFQTGSAKAVRDRSPRYFLTFNKSDDANRVQDILTALAFLQRQTPEKIELGGVGRAGVWCLFAAAVSNLNLSLHADLDGFSGRDEDFLDRFFVPGVQRAGGLAAALRLTAAMRSN